MNTAQIAAKLYQLQQVDLELDRLQTELQAVQHTMKDTSNLREIRAAYAKAQRQFQVASQAQKEAEWALDDIIKRLQEQEQRLYSGSISPKELQALQVEVQHLKNQQKRQEGNVLDMLEKVEKLQAKVETQQQAVREAEVSWEEERVRLAKRCDQLEVRLQELRSDRLRVVSTLDKQLLVRYETLRRNRQGKAVSKVEQNSCQWCRVILTPSELQHVRISEELQTCTNCGRILYYNR